VDLTYETGDEYRDLQQQTHGFNMISSYNHRLKSIFLDGPFSSKNTHKVSIQKIEPVNHQIFT